MNVLIFWFFWGMLILTIIFFALPLTLRFINNRAESLREFIENNDGFFSVFFIVLFAAGRSDNPSLHFREQTRSYEADRKYLRIVCGYHRSFAEISVGNKEKV
jgi:hypothetical protein